jgi:cytochrome c biogenesis protein CcmG/thiol:disulfide interchange protein DsbE
MKRNTLVLAAVLLVLAGFALASWINWEHRKQAAAQKPVPAVQGEMAASPEQEVSSLKGKAAPAFALEDLSGQKVSLASLKGKAVLINFWATWCAPCKIETPWMIELRSKYAAQGFEILGVAAEGDDLKKDDKAGRAKDKLAIDKFVRRMGVPYPVLLDGDSISQAYGGLDSLPSSFFVDRKGMVVAAQMGLTSEADIEANIQKALAAGK